MAKATISTILLCLRGRSSRPLSNANTPEKILCHVPKIYLATKTLELTGGGGGRRPKATKWISNVGVEEVMFQPAVALDGKAEVYCKPF